MRRLAEWNTTGDMGGKSRSVENSPQSLRRLHVFFSGTVQGVGFRYTVQRQAERFKAITGWVRNLSDGRVEFTAEGSADELESFLSVIQNEMSGYIDTYDRSWEAPTGEWTQFSIAPTR